MKHLFRTPVFALCALLMSLSAVSAQQQGVGYNDPAQPLSGATTTIVQPYTSGENYNDTPQSSVGGVAGVASGLSSLPAGAGSPNLDCADTDPGQPFYFEAPVAPNAGAYLRITMLKGNTNDQRFRIVVWSNTSLVSRVTVAGWQDSTVVKWPGGSLRFHMQRCVDYTFSWYFGDFYEDLTPNGGATGSDGVLRVTSGDRQAMIEWGPGIAPPVPPEPQIRLRVSYQKTCKGVNLILASGYVATNYGYASTVAAGSSTSVIVKSLRVAMVYDGPSFPLTRNPVDTATDQASVVTSEQLRSIGLGWGADVVCRGFKIVADATTYGGRSLHAEIHTR
jgi:hypothetical protein